MKYLLLLLISIALLASLSLAHETTVSVNVHVAVDGDAKKEEIPVSSPTLSLPADAPEASISNNSASSEVDSALDSITETVARWMRQFGKRWRASEIVKRTRIVKQNLMDILRHNSNPQRTSDQTLNEYSDMSNEEFVQKIAVIKPDALALPRKGHTPEAQIDEMEQADDTQSQETDDIALTKIVRPVDIDPVTGDGGVIPPEFNTDDFEFLSDEADTVEVDDATTAAALPDAFNWVSKGKVVAVRAQGECGSCWAFSSSDVISSVWAIKYNSQPLLLSPQYLVDCNNQMDSILNFANKGCQNGAAVAVYRFLYDHTHVSDDDYPYVGYQHPKCYDQRVTKLPIKTNDLFGYYQMFKNPQDMMRQLVKNGPMVVYVAGSDPRFKNYHKGIISQCAEKVDHAVMLVGYGKEKGVDYWIIKNSWGDQWGEKGFGRIRRGTNTCGVETEAVQPMV